jgi:hypothetical protein
MTGDWAYDALVPIAGLEFTILGLAVALSIIHRGHGLFPLRSRTKRTHLGDQGLCGGPSDEEALS